LVLLLGTVAFLGTTTGLHLVQSGGPLGPGAGNRQGDRRLA
jgi:hypothetical protein